MLLAFPSIYIDTRGVHEFRDGALYSLPPELTDNFRMSKYITLRKNGWQRTEFGYYALVKEDRLGGLYILPGLYLSDEQPPLKKIKGYNAHFTKKQVEGYLERHLQWEEEIRRKSELELTALVHDLRHLSGSIYHSAIEAESALNAIDSRRTAEGIRTIIAAQTMLKVRIDYLDFANSVDRFEEAERIPVYSRVDKVIRCFRASARHRNIEIELNGESFRLAVGPNILDIVPYTLIENAIKYAPANSTVLVRVEDADQSSTVTVTSKGPEIETAELEALFRRGFRGINASKLKSTGTGLGLAVAYSVLQEFQGKITVGQTGDVRMIDGIPYRDISFSFTVPTSGEDMARRRRRMDTQQRKLARTKRARFAFNK